MLLLIPLLPCVGFVVNALLGRRLSKTVSGGAATVVVDLISGTADTIAACPRGGLYGATFAGCDA